MGLIRRLRVSQRAMERAKLGVSLRDMKNRHSSTSRGAHGSEKDWIGVPRCWNGSRALVSAAFVDPQRGGQTTLSAWKVAAQNRGI
ncbi:jg27819 [Pararge aegeria aegeria]|uniref:Jg27819 protein n=1 Tax=Pararge aegeria aegeria TaxID=348720 RepID=A0A8S4QJ72_9NEOP|nr:jg27819 [Pararge aegeria aegeria]